MVGIVLVSHSRELARGLADLASQVAGSEVKIEPAFHELHREIWATLKAEVLRGYAQTGGS